MLERFTSWAQHLAGRAPGPHGSPRKGCLGAMAGVLPGPHLRGAGSQMQTAQQADLSSICSRRAGRSRGCQPPVAGAFPGRTPLLSSALHLPLYALFFQGTPPVGRLYGLPECARFSLRRASVLWFSTHTSHRPRQGFSSGSATARGGVCDPEVVTFPDSSSSPPRRALSRRFQGGVSFLPDTV